MHMCEHTHMGLACLILTYIPKQKCHGNSQADDCREQQNNQQPFCCSHCRVRGVECRMLASFTKKSEQILNYDIASVIVIGWHNKFRNSITSTGPCAVSNWGIDSVLFICHLQGSLLFLYA